MKTTTAKTKTETDATVRGALNVRAIILSADREGLDMIQGQLGLTPFPSDMTDAEIKRELLRFVGRT